MRLSVRKNDSGYSRRLSYKARPFLDGRPVSSVITADEDRGEIIRHVTDEEGNVVLNKDRTEIVEEVLRGDVEIVLPKYRRKHEN